LRAAGKKFFYGNIKFLFKKINEFSRLSSLCENRLCIFLLIILLKIFKG